MAESLDERAERKLSSAAEEETSTSYITALVLMIPGVILYAYTLYIMISKLVYPASFLPFTDYAALAEHQDSQAQEQG